MYCSYLTYSYGFKNLRNVIVMALKPIFLLENYINHPAAGVSAFFYDTIELHQFVQHGA